MPLSAGESHLWIVDFKTTLQGSRSDEEFEATEIAKYKAQLEAYAELRRSLPDGNLPIQLGLFYPLLPRLLYWSSDGSLECRDSDYFLSKRTRIAAQRSHCARLTSE